MEPHEELFQRLQSRVEIAALIGQTENLHLDCKTWPFKTSPPKDDDGQKTLAKAFSGFANADGGVVVIGMDTKVAQKYDPDLISGEQPVADAIALKARIEALVGGLVEPPLRGVRLAAVPNQVGSDPGFVLVHVPPTDGSPARSRKDWHFYVRSGSGTYPMEYFQIADMFGRRRRASLVPYFGAIETRPTSVGGTQSAERRMVVGLRNEGRGVAKFPSIHVSADRPLRVREVMELDGNTDFGLPRLLGDPGLKFAFGGGVDHVIHPGTTLKVTQLVQNGRLAQWQPAGTNQKVFVLDAINITIEMHADEVQAKTDTVSLPEQEYRL